MEQVILEATSKNTKDHNLFGNGQLEFNMGKSCLLRWNVTLNEQGESSRYYFTRTSATLSTASTSLPLAQLVKHRLKKRAWVENGLDQSGSKGGAAIQWHLSSQRNRPTSTSKGTTSPAPWASLRAGRSAEKQPGTLLGKELEGRQQQERPAKAGDSTRGCGGTSKISPVLKTLLSMPVFQGFVNCVPYVTRM